MFSSPPYNLGKEYESEKDFDAYLCEQTKIILELCRVLRPRGSICWQVGNYLSGKNNIIPLDAPFYRIFKAAGLMFRGRFVWHYGFGYHLDMRFSGRHDTVIWFTKTDEFIFNSPATLTDVPQDVRKTLEEEWTSGIMEIPNVRGSHAEKTLHPCQFPVELVERFVLTLSEPGATVLDPFCGVGSSVIAAVKHNRNGIGIDHTEDYLDVAVERLNKLASGTLRMRPLGQKLLVPSGKLARVPTHFKYDRK